ncbi:hypothetical protein PIB30_020919, partial [Stylosanthes scabra]|nr:hypothetical protein [Stylosanthes scabra]
MESSLTTTLASESFSYSWLSSSSSSSSSCKSSTTSPLEPNCQNFNFDISLSSNLSPNSSCLLAYADELFSGGTIKPLFVFHPNNRPTTTSSLSSNSREDIVSPISSVEIHHHHDGLFTKWKASTRRTLKNISRCIGRLNRKVIVCSSEKSVRVIVDADNYYNNKKKERQVKRSSITVHPIVGSFPDAHHENSIYEAVLHCKRSI